MLKYEKISFIDWFLIILNNYSVVVYIFRPHVYV